jgi:5-methylcytosine-specific restriction endonuclease McrA
MLRACRYCGRMVAHGATCSCAGATAARKRRDDHAHANQCAAGRNTQHWRHVRLAVMRRDDYTCRICKRTRDDFEQGERLEVHLDPSYGGMHHAAKVEDCITVCNRCHGRLPKGR